ncbi:MAG TPA: undecaprenyl-diphosphate phosphatase [Acidimicrobiia bacterium]|nr:undecaprenyl-diphosphate phosphatase [Acidimicrobiia bacterium]
MPARWPVGDRRLLLPQRRHRDDFRLRDALLMGGAQAVALQPGVSRSGITISMGRWLRFDRTAAGVVVILVFATGLR